MNTTLVPLDDLAPITLDELNADAALLTRVDRKYVVAPEQLDRLIDRVAEQARILEIDGHRQFDYRSVYFDTPTFDSYLGAARQRPDRFKVRSRHYLDATDTATACWVEVKLRNRRGQTDKHRHPYDVAEAATLSPDALAFVASFSRLEELAHELQPAATTRYRRATMVAAGARATVDLGFECTSGDGTSRDCVVTVGDHAIVETKSHDQPSAVDRALWELGVRPTTISKFAVGIATFHPDLPSNKWRRTIARYVLADDAGT
jgi:hypothetical protein